MKTVTEFENCLQQSFPSLKLKHASIENNKIKQNMKKWFLMAHFIYYLFKHSHGKQIQSYLALHKVLEPDNWRADNSLQNPPGKVFKPVKTGGGGGGKIYFCLPF